MAFSYYRTSSVTDGRNVEANASKGLFRLCLEQQRGEIGKILAPEGPDVTDIRDFRIGQCDAFGLQPIAELAVHADKAIGSAAGNP